MKARSRSAPFARPGYGSHLPALLAAMRVAPSGPVLELGAGLWSTPVLHQICAGRRQLTSVEPDPWLRELLAPLHGTGHRIVATMDDVPLWQAQVWALMLVDHGGAERARALRRIRARVAVVHDTQADEAERYPGLEAELERYSYRLDVPEPAPQTTIVSNAIDVSTLEI